MSIIERVEKHLIISFFVFVSIITVLWYLSALYIINFYGCVSSPGEAGDMFGAIGALFSGCAFCGIVLAIFLQRQDLKATREEMKQTREANQQSADMLEKQAKLTEIQIKTDIARIIIETIIASRSSTFHKVLEYRISERLGENYETVVDNIDELLEFKEEIKDL